LALANNKDIENGRKPSILHLPLTISYNPLAINPKSTIGNQMSSSFQEIILKLQDFRASKGYLVTQPYYTQVGAGAMNPTAFLRVLFFS